MGLKEKLEVLVDANVQGFVRGMETAGASAERNLGKTDDRVHKMAGSMMSWGAAAVGASAVAAVGLGKLASLAGEAEVAQLKLTNSIKNSSQSFKNNGQALRDQASALQRVTATDDEAIVSMQAMLVQFGLTEDQTKTLTPLVNDLSRKMGIDLPAAAKAVGKATQGSTGALARYGIILDKNAVAADGFGAVVQGLQSRVGGFATAEGRTFSGQLEIIKNQLSELGEGVGRGVTSTLSDIVGGITDLSTSLGDANPGITAAVGSFATLATIGVGGLGAISFVAGSFVKLKDSVQGLSGPLRDTEGALTGIGKGAAILGGAAIGAAVIGSVIEIGNAWNKASQDAAAFNESMLVLGNGKAGDQTKAFAVAVNSLTGDLDRASQSADAYSKSAGAQVGSGNPLAALNSLFGNNSDLIGTVGKGSAKIKLDLNQLGEAIDKIGEGGNIVTIKNALRELGNVVPVNPESKKEIKEQTKRLKDMEQSTIEAAAAERNTTLEATKAAAARRSAGLANSEYAATSDDVKEAIGTLDTAIAGATASYTTGQAAAKGWADAVAAGSGVLNSQLDAAQGVGSSFKTLNESIGALPKSYDILTASAGGYSDAQNKALDALQGVGTAIQGQIGTLLTSGASYDQVKGAAANYEGQLRTQLTQLGITGQAQDDYIKLLGLTPDQVNTDITISGAEQARQQLQVLQGDFDNLPPEKQSQIYALIAKNDWPGALALYQQFKDSKNSNINATTTGLGNWITAKSWFDGFRDKSVTINANVSGAGKDWAGNPLPGHAAGGPVAAGQMYMVGEKGPELFVSNTAGSIIPNNKLTRGGDGASIGGGGTTIVQNITFQGPVTDEQWVIDTISKANRRGLTSLAP